MKTKILTALLCLPITLAAQFPIGSRSITFNDPSRGGRAIPCEVYYPAVVAGTATELADGAFPVLAFGHGFAMGVGAYGNITGAFVPEGYIVVLPTTEGSLIPAPSHLDFGLDLAFVIDAMQAQGLDNASSYFAHVASTSAVMGHSMGGGASFLAAASSPAITTLVTYAPAETNPSAIAAAAQIDIPALVLAGSQDCVTPPGSNQVPMFEALSGACKAYVEITGGGHCNFANSNFNCSFGELTCGGGGSLGREGQQALADQYTLLWLDRYLKDDAAAEDEFLALLGVGAGMQAPGGSWTIARP
ncbi:MAG: dienelactone hydrolase family protein [Flavobacteriales bacterium]